MGHNGKKPSAYAHIRKKDIPQMREQFLRTALSQSATNGYKPFYVFDASALIDLYYLRLMSTTLEMTKGQSIITPSVVEETKRMIPVSDSQLTLVSPNCALTCKWRCNHATSLLDMINQHPESKHYEKLALGVNYDVCPQKKLEDDPISPTDLQLLTTALSLAANAADFGFPSHRPIVLTADAHIHLPLKALSNPGSDYYRDTGGKYQDVGVFHTTAFREELQREEWEWRKYAK